MSLDQFKTWLAQLIVDKKGALPDFNDWKLIKQQLDRVKTYDTVDFDLSGMNDMYTIDLKYWMESQHFKHMQSNAIPSSYYINEVNYNGSSKKEK